MNPGRKLGLIAPFAVAAMLLTLHATAADLTAPPLTVNSCQVMSGSIVPQRNEIGLAVRFRNTGSDPLTAIVFRAKYGAGWIDFEDDGTFAPQTKIDNFLLYEVGGSKINWVATAAAVLTRAPMMPSRITDVHFDDSVGLNDPQNCTVMRTVSASGKVYVNPSWPRPHAVLPTPGPDPRSTAFPEVARKVQVPVAFAHCRLTLRGVVLTNPTLAVVFANTTKVTADRITFRASYGTGAIDFTDAGSFAPGVLIYHQLTTPADQNTGARVFTSFDDPAVCDVVSLHYADGSTWSNPALRGAAPEATPVPDGIRISHQKLIWTKTLGDPKP